MIVLHSATGMCQISLCNDLFPSLIVLFHQSVTSLVPPSMVVLPNRLLEYCFLYAL